MYCLCKVLVIATHSHHFQTSISCSTRTSTKPVLSVPINSKNPVVYDYLVKKFGIPKNKAIFGSNIISSSASPSTLQIVPDFLKDNGFTDSEIRTIISKKPELLASSVDKTLKPKFEYLKELGFNGNDLVELLMKNPTILMLSVDKYINPQVDFLRVWLISNENIVKALKRHSWILTNAHNVRVNVDILRDVGVRDKDIGCLLRRCPRFFAECPDWVRGVLERAEEFGLDHESRMYTEAVRLMACLSKDTVKAKFEVYKSYGWLQDDIVNAFKIYPTMLGLSKPNIRETMDYLIEEVGYEPRHIALRPFMLGCSLEKVLKPRNEMLNILLSRGLLEKKPDFYSVTYLSQEKFLKKYVMKNAYEIADFQQV